MTPREKMDHAARGFEGWFVTHFQNIGVRGPTSVNARLIFDQVTWFIAEAEREYGDPSVAPR